MALRNQEQKTPEASSTCRICGRRLTDPESVKLGIGPICIKKQIWEDVVGAFDYAMYEAKAEYETNMARGRADEAAKAEAESEAVAHAEWVLEQIEEHNHEPPEEDDDLGGY